MTEVPEHLLARSREARSRLTGEGGDAGGASEAGDAAPTPAETAPAAATPAPVADATPAEPPPPEPVPPYVEAARTRKKVPVWIVPVLLFLPIWAIYYVGLLEPPAAEEGGLLVEGAEVYEVTGGCAGCTHCSPSSPNASRRVSISATWAWCWSSLCRSSVLSRGLRALNCARAAASTR